MGRRRSNSAVIGGIFASTLATVVVASAVAPVQVIGITSAIVNDVRISRATAPRPRPVILRERVALADQVQTGQRSQLQLLLLDRSVFTVGANARLKIDRYVYDPGGGRSFTASVAKGAFRFISGKADRGGGSSINSPVATIGIRGTIVDGVIGQDAIDIASGERGITRGGDGDPEAATLVILRGPGPRTQGGLTVGAITVTAANKSVELDRPMLAAYVPYRGATPIGPFTISSSGLARVQDLIFPSLAERKMTAITTGSQPYLPPAPRGGRYESPPWPDDGERGPPSRPSYLPELPGLQPPAGMAEQRPTPRPAPAPQPTRAPPPAPTSTFTPAPAPTSAPVTTSAPAPTTAPQPSSNKPGIP